jgi:AmiR/NasT family two-component response regulator
MSQRRAVIICFDDRLRGSLRQHLAGLGFVTWNEVRDGRAALAQIRRAHPQLVVLAPPLPSLDAAQLTETMIRGELAPLVLVLPEGEELEEASVREVALCARLTRPFTPATLADAVQLAQVRFEQLVATRADLRQLQRERRGKQLLQQAKSLLIRRWSIDKTEAVWRIQQHCLQSGPPAQAAIEALIAAEVGVPG